MNPKTQARVLSTSLALSMGYFYEQRKGFNSMAFASPATLKKSAILLSASKLNPQFEKRYRNGEDALVVSEDGKFVAVMDGVGGWIGRLVDTGKLTREFAGLLKK